MIALSLALGFAACLICIASWYGFASIIRHRRRTVSAMEKLADEISSLNKYYADGASYTASIPALMNGLIEVSKVQVENLSKLTESVNSFRDNLFSKGNDYSPYSEASVNKANEEWEVQKIMKQAGLTEVAARDRVREANVYRSLKYSGNGDIG